MSITSHSLSSLSIYSPLSAEISMFFLSPVYFSTAVRPLWREVLDPPPLPRLQRSPCLSSVSPAYPSIALASLFANVHDSLLLSLSL